MHIWKHLYLHLKIEIGENVQDKNLVQAQEYLPKDYWENYFLGY